MVDMSYIKYYLSFKTVHHQYQCKIVEAEFFDLFDIISEEKVCENNYHNCKRMIISYKSR